MSVADVFVLATHAVALPAIFRAASFALRVQIVVAVAVSVAFHAVESYAEHDAGTLDTLQRLDHATSTALIATVLLQEVAAVGNVASVVALLAGLAASLVHVGNMIAVGVVVLAVALLLLGALRPTQARGCLRNTVSLLTLGGTPSAAGVQWNGYLTAALILQVLSATAYGVGEWVEDPAAPATGQSWARGWHSAWHALAFLALWALVEYARDRQDTAPGQKNKKAAGVVVRRAERAEYKTFAPPRAVRW